nr:hypothetical protein [Tanacetum cinerariifolium]
MSWRRSLLKSPARNFLQPIVLSLNSILFQMFVTKELHDLETGNSNDHVPCVDIIRSFHRFSVYLNIDQRVKRNLRHSVKERMMKKIMQNVSGETESDDDEDDFVHPNLSTYNVDDQEEEDEEEKANDDDKVSSDQKTPSSDTTIPQPPILIIQPQQQTHDSITIIAIPTTSLPEFPNFASIFGFEQRVSSLKFELYELKQTNQFAEAVSSISGIVDNYLGFKMKDVVNVAVQLQSNKLREEAQTKNDEFFKQIDSNIKAIIKDQVKALVSKILPKVEKYVIESLRAELLTRSSNQPQTSYGVAASLSEFKGRDDQDKDKEPSAGANQGTKRRRSGKEELSKEATQKESKTTSFSKEPFHQEFNTTNDDVSPVRETKTVDDRPPQSWMNQLAQTSGTQSLFNEFLATPIDFSAFIMNQLKINDLTQDVLIGLTYDLKKGTCKSVVELEYHLKEVFKATNDQLDWHNHKGRPYPHDLSKPLPLIQNARVFQVIPFDHFINNDLEYLKGGSLSKKYTTSITKTKAVDYDHVQWIEDKVPRSIWSLAQVVYDKHAYWGTYH